jgi:gag-polypeptide of LTR copia-type
MEQKYKGVPLLGGSNLNYTQWKSTLEKLLLLNPIPHTKDAIIFPYKPKDISTDDWARADASAMLLIEIHTQDEVRNLLPTLSSAYDMWAGIQNHFGHGKKCYVAYALQNLISSMHQAENEQVKVYLARFMENYNLFKSSNGTMEEFNVAVLLLLGASSKFNSLRQNLMLKDDLTIADVSYQLRQADSQLKSSVTDFGLLSTTGASPIICGNCKKTPSFH